MDPNRDTYRGNPQDYTVGFYNLENLFDTRNDPRRLDDDFTPDGRLHWTPKKYENKLSKLARTIARLGEGSGHALPVLLGVAEIENRKVLEDLINTPGLAGHGLQFIHRDSPDERGIDAALIYSRAYFEPEVQEMIPLLVFEPDGSRDFTRDIVYVRGRLNGERLHIFVNHWPSRRSGDLSTEQKRMVAAETIVGHMEKVRTGEDNPNFIVMGDFNDGPTSDSLRRLKAESGLLNPLESALAGGRGSAKYKDHWMLFDQILLSKTFLHRQPGTHSLEKADIFDPEFLKERKLPFRGKPFRTFVGQKYLGGYSDHFPVYVRLRYHP